MKAGTSLYELLIPGLIFLAVVTIGGAILVVRAFRQRSIRQRLRESEAWTPAAAADASKPPLVKALEMIGMTISSGAPSPTLRQSLATAGYHGPHVAGIFLGAKFLVLAGSAVGLTVFLLPVSMPMGLKILTIISGAGLSFFLPNLIVRQHREARRADVRSHLPDTLDLLEICVSSGMGLDAAWNSVADEIRDVSPTLADEMALTNLELHLGGKRAVALRNMAERTGAEEISSLVAVLVQSERFGTSVAEALRTFAKSMRESRSFRAEVSAEKMAVKLLFPMILFIFPTIVLVTVGPAGITLVDLLKGGK